MKLYSVIIISFVFMVSCHKKSVLNDEFSCKTYRFSELKTFKGIKNNFSVKFPKKWKTNYYYDNIVSSIYATDTTLSLTQATLIDVSHIATNPIKIDDTFINKIKMDNQKMGLKEIKSKTILFLDKPSYYSLSVGKKNKYDYRILNIFSENPMGFLHIKTEIYGDSLVDKRICEAISLINEIQIIR